MSVSIYITFLEKKKIPPKDLREIAMVNEFCVPESIVFGFFFKIHSVYIFNIL